jgi:hypothetical protein
MPSKWLIWGSHELFARVGFEPCSSQVAKLIGMSHCHLLHNCHFKEVHLVLLSVLLVY